VKFHRCCTGLKGRLESITATWQLRATMQTTTPIASLNASLRAATRHRGHFSNEQRVMQVLSVAVLERCHNRVDSTGEIANRKDILKTLAMTYREQPELNQLKLVTQENRQTPTTGQVAALRCRRF
jgi:transposase-like protein